MDLLFDVHDAHTEVHSRFHACSLDVPLHRLELDARELEILDVSCDGHAIRYAADARRHKLVITFESPVPPETAFVVNTHTICRPTRNVLEGLYYDETPPGAPPQQITQCQQWGFQRLVPCIDDMTAKCTYVTTIIADERYTHLITNGDVTEPKHSVGGGRASITYANVTTPMAPYLFFLGVGTYASISRELEYPDGRTVMLELLVPPRSERRTAREALDILHDAVMWVHLWTGPDRYGQQEARRELERLVRERDALKATGAPAARIGGIRRRLSELARTVTPGYTYTGTVYREIGMQNSDFGGMENVGNTTITTNRIMPFPDMTDPAYEYMIRVKVHEYYHNLNGSEVTGCTPFELWLNEAVTVHIERWYHASLFGAAYSRLQTALTLLSPESGTLALDAGSTSMPIEPDGFDDPNDLITGITYVKGPEFVRMIESMMGREAFVKGLDRYHGRYRHGNATTDQWIEAMEETAGRDLSAMAGVWLRRTGYPTIVVRRSGRGNGSRLALTISQTGHGAGESPWIFPFHAIAYDSTGRSIGEVTKMIEGRHEEAVLDLSGVPAFLSINPGYAAYGRLADDATGGELHLQVRRDPDLVNRYIAFSRLAEAELMRLLADGDALPGEQFLDLFIELVADDDLMQAAGGQFLTIFESVADPRYMHRYRALFEARKRLLHAIAARHHGKLHELHQKYSRPRPEATLQDRARGIKQRQVKNLCLAVLATLDTPAIHALIRDQIERSTNATDRITAFALYVQSSAPDKRALIERFQAESRANLVSWEAFLAAIGSNAADDAVGIVRDVAASPDFRIEQANEQRALFGRFAQNRMISLESPEGRDLLAEILRRLATTNEFSTVQALRAFANLDRMEEEHTLPLVAILADLLAMLDPDTTPSVYNTIRRILAGAPRSVQRYESERGAIERLR